MKSSKILSWNVRGMNSPDRCIIIRSKISKSFCEIVCLQETKKYDIYLAFIRTCCPKDFDKFVFLPSVGAYGGSTII
jgi:exonuclease III